MLIDWQSSSSEGCSWGFSSQFCSYVSVEGKDWPQQNQAIWLFPSTLAHSSRATQHQGVVVSLWQAHVQDTILRSNNRIECLVGRGILTTEKPGRKLDSVWHKEHESNETHWSFGSPMATFLSTSKGQSLKTRVSTKKIEKKSVMIWIDLQPFITYIGRVFGIARLAPCPRPKTNPAVSQCPHQQTSPCASASLQGSAISIEEASAFITTKPINPKAK